MAAGHTCADLFEPALSGFAESFCQGIDECHFAEDLIVLLYEFDGFVDCGEGVGFANVEESRDVVQHDAGGVVYEGGENGVCEVFDAVAEDGGYDVGHALRVIETDVLELTDKVSLGGWEREGVLVLVEVWQGDAVDVAHYVVVHAVDEKEGAELMRFASDVDVVGREV